MMKLPLVRRTYERHDNKRAPPRLVHTDPSNNKRRSFTTFKPPTRKHDPSAAAEPPKRIALLLLINHSPILLLIPRVLNLMMCGLRPRLDLRIHLRQCARETEVRSLHSKSASSIPTVITDHKASDLPNNPCTHPLSRQTYSSCPHASTASATNEDASKQHRT
jgi:hypothetical protein